MIHECEFCISIPIKFSFINSCHEKGCTLVFLLHSKFGAVSCLVTLDAAFVTCHIYWFLSSQLLSFGGKSYSVCCWCMPSVSMLLLPVGQEVVRCNHHHWIVIASLEIVIFKIFNEFSIISPVTPQQECMDLAR